MKTTYLQGTKGFDAEVIVAPLLAYTTDATIEDFVANAPNGEIGIYNAATKALITGAAIAANVKFFIVQMRNGRLHKLADMIKNSDLTITKILGDAGVSKVIHVVISCGGDTSCESCKLSDAGAYTFELQDRSVASEPDTWTYILGGKRGKTIGDLLSALRAQINDPNFAVNKVRGQAATMSIITTTAGTVTDDVLSPTTYAFDITVIGTTDLLLNISGFCESAITITTKAKYPSLAVHDVAEFDREGTKFAGQLNEFADPPAKAADFGDPTQYSASGTTLFTEFQLNALRKEDSTTPVEQHVKRVYQTLFVPKSSALQTSLETILGV